MTPLHLAVKHGHLSVVEYLVIHNANINEKTSYVEYLNYL